MSELVDSKLPVEASAMEGSGETPRDAAHTGKDTKVRQHERTFLCRQIIFMCNVYTGHLFDCPPF